MDSRFYNKWFGHPEYQKLSYPEKTVFEILASGKAPDHNVSTIAKISKMSEMHVKVALQLLYLRNMTDVNPEESGS